MTNAQLNTISTTTDTDTFHAQPYDVSGTGFYFHAWSEYCEKANANRCEEFEIQYIDGEDAELFKACGVDQSNLDLYLDCIPQLEDYELVSLFYVCDVLGYGLADGLDAIEDYPATEGSALDYAYEYIDDSGMLDALPEQLRYYFDYSAFARDMVLNGDIYEFDYSGSTYVANR